MRRTPKRNYHMEPAVTRFKKVEGFIEVVVKKDPSVEEKRDLSAVEEVSLQSIVKAPIHQGLETLSNASTCASLYLADV
jgi:hypothetical protein